MGMNIENVAKALGISKKSAEALDALDGKSDKQVKQSIYDETAKLLNTVRTSKGDRSVFANTEFKEEVYNALEDDLTKIMGFVKSENTKPEENECKISTTKEENNVTHKRIEHPNVGWAEMVKAYYPDLIKKCDGELYGENGAIRAFQKALCTDENGNIDNEKLKQLMLSSDIPKEIKLPEKIDGAARENNKPMPNPQNVIHSASSKQVAPNVYIATDGANGTIASGSTIEESIENLAKLNARKYQLNEK